MRYLAALLFFIDITAAIPEQVVEQWWPDEWGAPCTTKTDRRELGATCTVKVRKPKGRKWEKNVNIVFRQVQEAEQSNAPIPQSRMAFAKTPSRFGCCLAGTIKKTVGRQQYPIHEIAQGSGSMAHPFSAARIS